MFSGHGPAYRSFVDAYFFGYLRHCHRLQMVHPEQEKILLELDYCVDYLPYGGLSLYYAVDKIHARMELFLDVIFGFFRGGRVFQEILVLLADIIPAHHTPYKTNTQVEYT